MLEKPINAMEAITLWFATMHSTEAFPVQSVQVASSRGISAATRLLAELLRFAAIALLRVQDAELAGSSSISAATRLLKKLNAPLKPVDLDSLWKGVALLLS